MASPYTTARRLDLSVGGWPLDCTGSMPGTAECFAACLTQTGLETGVNCDAEGRQVRRVLGCYGGTVGCRAISREVAVKGYRASAFGCVCEGEWGRFRMNDAVPRCHTVPAVVS